MRQLILILFVITNSVFAQSQSISGKVLIGESNSPVEFVNIGIAGKNIGTISDTSGKYRIDIDPIYDNETLVFSCIGYETFSIRVIDFKESNNWDIHFQEKTYKLNDVVIIPKDFKKKTLGVTTKTKSFQAGFKDNLLGYECGVLMKIKKSAVLEQVNISIANCTYDSIFYRLNIYQVKGKMEFENILQKPIYVSLRKEQVGDKISIDLKSENIVVEGDFLITLEHIKNLGEGNLYFSAGLANKTYYRKTSQGAWQKTGVGISISVIADVEF